MLTKPVIQVEHRFRRAPEVTKRSAVYVASPLKKVSARHVRTRFALKHWLIPAEKRLRYDRNQVEGEQSENLAGH